MARDDKTIAKIVPQNRLEKLREKRDAEKPAFALREVNGTPVKKTILSRKKFEQYSERISELKARLNNAVFDGVEEMKIFAAQTKVPDCDRLLPDALLEFVQRKDLISSCD